MRRRIGKNDAVKYAAILCAMAVLVAAFLLLRALDRRHGQIDVPDNEKQTVTYNGQEYRYNEDIETFLVLGLDRYEDEPAAASHNGGVQTDFIMLFVFDNAKKQCTAIHIDRDTITKVNKLSVGGTAVVDSFTCQIALAHNYVNTDNEKIRCRNTKDSVVYLLNGIKVNHFLSVTMDVVPVLCDCLGGVEVTVLDDFTGVDDTLVKGEQALLTGETALRYVRSRYGVGDGTNRERMARQRQFINAALDRVDVCAAADDTFLLQLLDAIDEYVVYDSSNEKMMKYLEKRDTYEYLGIRELEGQSVRGEEYMEFYPDEAAKQALIMDLFYVPVN